MSSTYNNLTLFKRVMRLSISREYGDIFREMITGPNDDNFVCLFNCFKAGSIIASTSLSKKCLVTLSGLTLVNTHIHLTEYSCIVLRILRPLFFRFLIDNVPQLVLELTQEYL